MHLNQLNLWQPVYANDLSAWDPELWARESIAILEESLIWGNLVHRDFNTEVASFGDIVNTRKPAEFTAQQYAKGDSVTVQDATATNVQVKLDQIADVSFRIYDVEQTYSFANLVEQYLKPAVHAIGRRVDRKIAGQAAQFLGNTTGGAGQLSASNVREYLVATDRKLNEQKVSDMGRNLVISAVTKEAMLRENLFVAVDQSGENSALRRANIGQLFGMDVFMSLNTPNVQAVPAANLATATTVDGAIVAGAASVATDGDITQNNGYITMVGDMTPIRIGTVSGAGPYTVPFASYRLNREAVADGVAVQPYVQGAVDLGAGYAAGWTKAIHVDGGSGVTPQLGGLVSFDDHTDEYIIVEVTNTAGDDYDIVLDRGLENAIADDDTANYGPVMDCNLAFQRSGITLVNRPLEIPQGATGSNVAVANGKNLSMRVATTYEQTTKSLLVSVDALFGVKTLDAQYGCVMLG